MPVGQLTGGIAHDFNNILSIVLANAQLLAGDPQFGAGESGVCLKEVESAAQRGASMVKQLLSFSRRADLFVQPTDMGTILDRTVSIVRRILPESIEVKSRGDEVPCAALVDEVAVEQILLNLANNARDAMSATGALCFEMRGAILGAEEKEIHLGAAPRLSCWWRMRKLCVGWGNRCSRNSGTQ